MKTLATRILTASKKTFKSARAAWISIGERTGLEPSDVRSAGHTRTLWRWKTTKHIRKKRQSTSMKLHGAAKAAFLRRMAAGRRKASGRKAPKRRTTKRKASRKTIKRRSSPKRVAKRRAAPKKKGILGNIPLINNPTFRKAALGVGTATLGVTILGLVAPGIASNPIVRPVLALAGGGVPGVIAQVLAQGGLGALTGGLGGGSSGGGAGFA